MCRFWERIRQLLAALVVLAVGGCATFEPPPQPSGASLPPAATRQDPLPVPVKSALPPLAELAPLQPEIAPPSFAGFEGKVFSMAAHQTPLKDVLLGLAKQARLNLVFQHGVDPMEPVSMEMHDLPLQKTLDLLLGAHGYFYDMDGNVLIVKNLETKIFHFDFPVLVNTPQSKVGGDMLGGGDSSGSSSNISGEYTIETEVDSDALKVWDQVEEALGGGEQGGDSESKGLLSDQGRVQINKASGTIVVTDRQENLRVIETYLREVEGALQRQVILEAKIIEVELDQAHQYGIDWSLLSTSLFGGELAVNTSFTTGTGNLTVNFLESSGDNQVGSFIEALASQGNVNVLSSPRLNVLNNQSALINVGTTIPYLSFELSSVEDPNDSTRNISELVPEVMTAQKGVSLGVTPRIDPQGTTTLHITPVITDSNHSQEFTVDNISWSVPILDVRQTDTIVRVANRETIVLGGLIQERSTDSQTQVPLLGKTPLFGKLLFSREEKINQKLELVILLTPTVVEL